MNPNFATDQIKDDINILQQMTSNFNLVGTSERDGVRTYHFTPHKTLSPTNQESEKYTNERNKFRELLKECSQGNKNKDEESHGNNDSLSNSSCAGVKWKRFINSSQPKQTSTIEYNPSTMSIHENKLEVPIKVLVDVYDSNLNKTANLDQTNSPHKLDSSFLHAQSDKISTSQSCEQKQDIFQHSLIENGTHQHQPMLEKIPYTSNLQMRGAIFTTAQDRSYHNNICDDHYISNNFFDNYQGHVCMAQTSPSSKSLSSHPTNNVESEGRCALAQNGLDNSTQTIVNYSTMPRVSYGKNYVSNCKQEEDEEVPSGRRNPLYNKYLEENQKQMANSESICSTQEVNRNGFNSTTGLISTYQNQFSGMRNCGTMNKLFENIPISSSDFQFRNNNSKNSISNCSELAENSPAKGHYLNLLEQMHNNQSRHQINGGIQKPYNTCNIIRQDSKSIPYVTQETSGTQYANGYKNGFQSTKPYCIVNMPTMVEQTPAVKQSPNYQFTSSNNPANSNMVDRTNGFNKCPNAMYKRMQLGLLPSENTNNFGMNGGRTDSHYHSHEKDIHNNNINIRPRRLFPTIPVIDRSRAQVYNGINEAASGYQTKNGDFLNQSINSVKTHYFENSIMETSQNDITPLPPVSIVGPYQNQFSSPQRVTEIISSDQKPYFNNCVPNYGYGRN